VISAAFIASPFHFTHDPRIIYEHGIRKSRYQYWIYAISGGCQFVCQLRDALGERNHVAREVIYNLPRVALVRFQWRLHGAGNSIRPLCSIRAARTEAERVRLAAPESIRTRKLVTWTYNAETVDVDP
jgi:hypothetical protein